MKIGFFTDTYHPSINGVTFVVDILRKGLEDLGHEVVIVAPRPGIRSKHTPHVPGVKVIWVPAIDGFFDEFLTSIFSPTQIVKKIERHNLDVVMFFTPGQIGLLGAFIAKRNQLPLVQQYSTDLIEYVKDYPSVIPGVFALSVTGPFALRMSLDEMAKFTKQLIKSRSNKQYTWSQEYARVMLKTLHNHCDELVAVSHKVASRLSADSVATPVHLIPTGVDALPADVIASEKLKKKLGILPGEKVILYVGRLAKEKNLDMLLTAFFKLAKHDEKVKLVLVGRFGYREHLEARVSESKYADKVIFTGDHPHKKIGDIYGIGDIFAFPSVTDTQALVLNEAAHAKLPIVWCDPNVNDVAVNGLSGILTKPTAASFYAGMLALVSGEKLRVRLGAGAQKRAQKYSEQRQAKLLARLLEQTTKG